MPSDFSISPLALAVTFILLLFGALLWWRIFTKAGYRGVTGLLMLIPLLNLLVLCFFAFRPWPIESKLPNDQDGKSGVVS